MHAVGGSYQFAEFSIGGSGSWFCNLMADGCLGDFVMCAYANFHDPAGTEYYFRAKFAYDISELI